MPVKQEKKYAWPNPLPPLKRERERERERAPITQTQSSHAHNINGPTVRVSSKISDWPQSTRR